MQPIEKNMLTRVSGVIIRDAKGEVLLSEWQMVKDWSTTEMVEAEAVLTGLKLGAEWVRQPAIIETDCESVVWAIQSNTNVRMVREGLLKEIKAASVLLPSYKYNMLCAQRRLLCNVPMCIRKIAREERKQRAVPGISS
jgi:ribonuclease HI